MTAQTSMFPQTYQMPRLKLLPIRERPAYRVQSDPAQCSLSELLATIVGGQYQIEIAQALVERFKGIRNLINATTFELTQVHHLGEATATRLKAALALALRVTEPVEPKPGIHCPEDIDEIVRPLLAHREQEYLVVILLNTRSRIIDVVEICHGNLNTMQVRIAEVFRPAIRQNAASIVVAHNHPSGDPTPSPDDVAITRVLVKTGKALDIEVLDHVIVGQGSNFTSLRKSGLGNLGEL